MPATYWLRAAAVSAPMLMPSTASALPPGEGRELVEALCTACHQLSPIERSAGYTREGWEELISTMVDIGNMEADRGAVLDYLSARFSPNDERAPVLIDGEAKIEFTEWVAPTLGQRTRDPVEAPDGSIWWAGQWADIVGRIDPRTGLMEEFALPPGSRPHTVTADTGGGIWYTGNGNGTVGRLDPRTGEVTVYPTGDPAAIDPHSAVVDADGLLWFTLQRANMIGRLDPATGRVKLVTAPTPASRPYGIKVAEDGRVWVASNGSNRLYSIEPVTMDVATYELPDPRTRVRRLALDSSGSVWFVNSSMGRIGRLDPRTGAVREWPSPSGPDSHPYAIAVIGDVIWYNESGRRPDALVRFDPAGEVFQSWAIPSGGIHAGIVRHMRPTRDGGLLIHQSSTNRIIRVDIDP